MRPPRKGARIAAMRHGLFSILGVAMVLAGCGGAPGEPGSEDIRAALARHYGQADAAGTMEPAVPAPEFPRAGMPDQAEPQGEVVDETIILSGEECTRIQVVRRERDGEMVEETIERPCRIKETVEAGLAAGLDALSEALRGISSAVEKGLGPLIVSEVADAEKIACVPANERPGFVCDVRAQLILGDGRDVERMISARFVRGERVWHAFEVSSAPAS